MIVLEKKQSRFKCVYPQWTGTQWRYITQIRHNRVNYSLGAFPCTEQGEIAASNAVALFKKNLPAIDCIEALRTGKISDEYKLKLLEALKK